MKQDERRRPRRRDGNEAGFSLIEILVVIAIIGLLMAIVGPRVLNYLGESKIKTTKIQIESFESALDLYFLDNGRYPTTSEGLVALAVRPGTANAWNGPYLRSGLVPNDPWGQPYVYRSPGEHGAYDIVSHGSGGQGGETDIESWKR